MARAVIFIILLYLGMKINSFITSSICFIRGSIGIPCPLCGMTRAIKLLLKGDINGAFNMHPLFIVIIILFIIVLFKGLNPLIKHKYSLSLLFISVYIYRMLFMFPTKAPLTFNNLAIFPRIFNFLLGLFKTIAKGII